MNRRIKFKSAGIGIVIFACLLLPACRETSHEKAVTYDISIVTDYSELKKTVCAAREDESILIADLRDNSDYEYAHLEGTVNIPFDDDGEWLLKYLKNNELQDKNIYLICVAGKKSAKAFNLLVEEGYTKVHYVSFGFDEYKENEGSGNMEGAGVCDCEK